MSLKLKNILFSFIVAGIISSIGLSSCIDESISTDPSLKLAFSTDTLFFDTVFTTIGSSTAKIKVYNPNEKNIKISAAGLGKGPQSAFRLNLDGELNPNHQFTEIELRARDSLFVFVEVTVKPASVNNPVFIKDSIVFLTNGNQQDVKLIAYGQDMEVLRNQTFKNDTVLNADKPYLIYGDLVVDTAKTLRLEAGCRLFFHDGASLVVYGNLIAEGTHGSPVLLRGDRTDRLFEDVPYNFVSNQWGGVLLLNKEGNHKLNFVQMNSGYVGISFSNNDRNFRPKLEITNSRIHNFLKYGLFAQNGDVNVANSEISNTGSYSVYLNGGKHTFVHSTIANYFNSTNILMQPSGKEGNSAVMIMELNRIIPMETTFQNCIVSGSSSNEFEILSRFSDRYNGTFSNSYLRKSEPDPVPTMFTQIKWYNTKDTVFVNSYFDKNKLVYYNFMLDSISPARDIGDYNVALLYPVDLNGNSRIQDGKPDAGAYEWQPAN
ncbi:MAG: choice-of-anchor Q domain-containing protein [Paludibacteraceae bacterium]